MKKEKVFADSIDFTELFKHVEAMTGEIVQFEEHEIICSNDRVSVELLSNDITDKCGVFSKIMNKCCVTVNGIVSASLNTGDMFLWADVSFHYEHKESGANGMKISNAWFTERDSWKFANVESC